MQWKPWIIKTLIAILLFVNFNIWAQHEEKIQLANEYYIQGDLAKAIELYEDLSKNRKNIPLIHNNYFNALITTKAFKKAERYIERLIEKFPDNILYHADLAILQIRQNDFAKTEKYLSALMSEIGKDQYKTRITAQYLVNQQLPEHALKIYKRGREAIGNFSLYALEIANIYRLLNKKDQMVEEYLNYLNLNPKNISYVKNILQNLLTEEDLVSLENILYERVQKFPNSDIYNELLIWVNLQQKNFYGAYIQAKAMDRKGGTEGDRVLEIGEIALDNQDYDQAIKMFEYVIKTYPASFNYILARSYLINAKEEKVKNTFPVQKEEIRDLINNYQELVEEIGINKTTLEALRNKALLHAFYLDEIDIAIKILNNIIKAAKSGPNLRAKAKLDLGDIYLLDGQPWESTLLYSQVEKAHKETPIGYEAKLRNAKLHYYKGDFALAQSHLDILKEATTREISNDAIALSLLIKDNTYLDTADLAMKEFAHVELLLFQDKREKARHILHNLLEEYPNHNLKDEILWLIAKLQLEVGNFKDAINLLENIIENHRHDILSDDAYFLMGKIYQDQLNDRETAMNLYKNFLTEFPGSVFMSEARKRFRQLRGDIP